ncbi:MAG: class I SAM-dependent RNA methyltransferase, partial [Lachnospiraceae bacterium]|nr:class I SAM-dependent RNA methyltransferase [Lachnospiraceae bacterium]
MKKGNIYEGIAKRLDFPNKAVVGVEGETDQALVKGALPGQKVSFSVKKKRGGLAEGHLLEILAQADYEYAPDAPEVCPHAATCGGCCYQTVPYEKQLEIKEDQVRRILEKAIVSGDHLESMSTDVLEVSEKSEDLEAAEEPEKACNMLFEGILPSPHPTEYRNKMEFSFGDEYKDGPLALGMHRRGSFYDIVTTGDCRIVHEDFRKILRAVLAMYASKDVTFFHKRTHQGYLRHLLVRRGVRSGEITVALVTTTRRQEESRAFAESASAELEGMADELSGGKNDLISVRKENETQLITEEDDELRSVLLSLPLSGKIVGISHIYNDSVADVIQSDRTDIIYGSDYFFEEILGLKFKISTFSFFQTNSLGAEVLYSEVREYAGGIEGKTIFDLYSGTGTIAQILAPVAKKVVGVEIVEEAVEAARENAALNGLANCEFIAGDVLKVLDSLKEKPDMIVLDPPRAGIHPKALQKIIAYGVEQIVYVSCKPTSLAVDLEALQAGGYRVERACCVDMFSSTANVETVVQLSKGEINSKKVRVEFSMEDMDMSGFQKGATYGQIKEYVKEHTGLSVSSLYIAQIKQ